MPHPPSLLLIVKWGGELTPAGKVQAEELGKAFRTLYPGGQGIVCHDVSGHLFDMLFILINHVVQLEYIVY